ncbi:MAG TPA: hypothetical protein VHL31_24410 [Geminicoccus sp.]|jgi:hypothetical protein|uniref:hypothetical protein n=1 Tax=Geminicoccus sp. TaxID=2024832 RepID=UPI002E2F693D|nr:hypothetical protein [Geminicoccus sp.]HEX2529423.1 hypothetical protein [Geminicoccus sp.]
MNAHAALQDLALTYRLMCAIPLDLPVAQQLRQLEKAACIYARKNLSCDRSRVTMASDRAARLIMAAQGIGEEAAASLSTDFSSMLASQLASTDPNPEGEQPGASRAS